MEEVPKKILTRGYCLRRSIAFLCGLHPKLGVVSWVKILDNEMVRNVVGLAFPSVFL
jgi:hypothetical protein